MTATRRLAAILAADVVGYSRLMGADEEGTLTRLKEHRSELIDPTITKHRGRIVKTTGDGILVEFASAVDAARCAVELQLAMAERGSATPPDKRIEIRIGIHVGDIIIDNDDIFGDGVNIAARLEGIAEPGGIMISGTVHDQVRDRLPYTFEDGGEQAMKNIARPVRVYRVRAENSAGSSPLVAPTIADAPLPLPDKPSIAVLPFQNMSGDPEQEYFADGMVEDIITALSRFKSLFVIARNSSFIYKGKAVDVKQVGRELGVRYVLEGSVRKAGGKVRITGQLIDSETGAHLWANRFDGSPEDLFDLQDQVTESVVGEIAPTLDKAEIERARRKPPENLAAYDCFLRGVAKRAEGTRQGTDEALRLFYRAIELDPGFATPYAMAATCYQDYKIAGRIGDREHEEAEVRRLVSRVSVIGRDDARALCWAGYSLVFVCRDYETGASLIDQALAINSNLADGWSMRGWVSMWTGQHEAAIEQLTRALRLSPTDPLIVRTERAMGLAHMYLGHHAEALKWAKQSFARNTEGTVSMRNLAAAYAYVGNVEEARKLMTRVLQLDPMVRLSQMKDRIATRRPEDFEKYVQGLRLAGMPE